MGKYVHARLRRRMLSVYREIPAQSIDCHQARSRIVGWNEGMARRMGRFVDNFRDDFTVMVTLTYPDEFPLDGRQVKAHFRAFIERLRRTNWFEEHSLVWFLEFQARGAPHLHLLSTGWISKNFVSKHWAAVTHGNPASCSRVESLRSPEAAGAYARKYARKEEQKVAPQAFENVGRFWGCCGRRINARGVPRVPCVEASTGFSLWLVRKAVQFALRNGHRVRFFEHDHGFQVYGTERALVALWGFLQGAGLFVDERETPPDASVVQRLGGLQNMLGLRVSHAMT